MSSLLKGTRRAILGAAAVAAPWVPTDITSATLRMWFRADTLGLNDNDLVGTWPDESGEGNDLVQGTTAFKPTFKTSIINSLPIVRFDNVDDRLRYAGQLSTAQIGSVWFVFQQASIPSIHWPWSSSDEATFNSFAQAGWFISDGAGGISLRLYDVPGGNYWRGNASASLSTPSIVAQGSNGTIWYTRLNGTDSGMTIVSGGASGDWFGDAPNRDSVIMGGRLDSAGFAFPFNGDIGELLILDGALSTDDRDALEVYLAAKWGISLP